MAIRKKNIVLLSEECLLGYLYPSLIIYVISVLFCYAFMHVCLLMPCGHLLGKGWTLGSHLWCLIVTLSLSHWYPGSGVVLDCIDSSSFLLWSQWICIPLHNSTVDHHLFVDTRHTWIIKTGSMDRIWYFINA